MKRLILAIAFSLVSSAAMAAAGCDLNGIGDAAKGTVMAHMNPLKNRTTKITVAQEISIAKILSFSGSEDAAREAQAVELKGQLLDDKHEAPESPNCHRKTRRDYHIWIGAMSADHPSGTKLDKGELKDAKVESVVVELTPNIQDKHPAWAGNLASLKSKYVCIKGWLFFDHDHKRDVGKSRGTQWEVHPIMEIGLLNGRTCDYWK